MIPSGFIQELLSRTDVAEVVGRHVELKKAGINYKGLCPFHGEKSPSFIVSPSRQTYHCFGCGVHGDAIRFLTEHHGLSFVEAVRDLAQGAGLVVPEDESSASERAEAAAQRERQTSLTDVMAKAGEHYRKQLKASPRAVDYLKARGLTGEIAQRYGLGYAPEGWRSLANAFARYDDPLLVESGMVILQGDEGDVAERKRYDRFRDRIMFPIRNVKGETIAFGGRVLDQGEPKYLNSPETPVFVKGRELYGLFESRTGMREKGYALVTEGYMDVVALAQLGFPNAVATLGTACTAEHVHKLLRFTEQVVFSFDGDAAGRRAAGRALEASLPHASDLRTVRFLFLPPEHDPDSYVRELGPEAFDAQVTQAVPLSKQLIVQASADADLQTAEGRARMLAQAKPLWMALPDGALKRQLLPELARQAQLDSADLSALWGTATASASAATSARNTPRAQGFASPAVRRSGRQAPAGTADLALRLLLRHSDWWERLSGEDHGLLHELGGHHGEAVAWLERQLTEHGPLTWAALDPLLADEPWREQARGWVNAAVADEEQGFEDLHVVVQRLLVERLDAQARALVKQAELSREDLEGLRALREQIAIIKAAAAGK